MSLIDADKLIKDIKQLWDYKTVDDITATTVLKQTITDIENQPTVKAIPIKWIKNYASHKASEDLIDCYWHFWEDDALKMIDDWEKENEAV